MAVYKRDLERISECYKNMQSVSDSLQRAYDSVVQAKAVTEANWQGRAAEQFKNNLQADLENIALLKSIADEQQLALGKAIEEGYKKCDKNTRDSARQFIREIGIGII